MGLDMYLMGRAYVWSGGICKPEYQIKVEATKCGKPMDMSKIKYLESEMGYWRKANHVHQWFVDNCCGGDDDCEPHYVSIEDLLKLKALCVEVLANKDKAEELLPISQGFFFGGDSYDEWYYNDLEDTIKIIEDCENQDDLEFSYQASW